MKRMIRYSAYLLVLFSLIMFPSGTSAQSPDELSSVRVRLWSEYDQPEMLVIYDLTLPAGTPLPATLKIRIPKTAGEPHAVASRELDGSLVNLPVVTEVASGDWISIEFTATTLDSRMEFYDPALVKDGTSRSYTYIWPGDYNVASLEIEVQQPVDATNMSLSPSMGGGVLGGDGLMYFGIQVGALEKGQSYQQNIEYQKATDTLSTELLTIEPAGPIDSGSAISTGFASFLPWLLFILGLLLLAGGGYWYWRLGRKTSQPARKKHRKGASKPSIGRNADSVISAADEESAIYCHQCGKRAMQGDRFCRICGTQLRI